MKILVNTGTNGRHQKELF